MSEMINRREIPLATEGEGTFGLKVFREEWDVHGSRKTYWKYDLPDVSQIIGLTPDKKIIAISEFQPGVGEEYFHLPGETLKDGEKEVDVKLVEPANFWQALMHHFKDEPAKRHGGGNTLKLAALAFHSMGWLTATIKP